jgi:hypothetical protein
MHADRGGQFVDLKLGAFENQLHVTVDPQSFLACHVHQGFLHRLDVHEGECALTNIAELALQQRPLAAKRGGHALFEERLDVDATQGLLQPGEED